MYLSDLSVRRMIRRKRDELLRGQVQRPRINSIQKKAKELGLEVTLNPAAAQDESLRSGHSSPCSGHSGICK
jgi:hypothetical protein